MSREHRPLTKSLFKLALECPRKLDYASKPHEYFDSSSQDAFLAKLAEGGYQVGELAKLMFPDGIDLSQLDQTEQLRLTRELLQRDSVVIFEAAIESEGLFARVDILRKQNGSVEIIEVKAKAFDPLQDAVFRGKKGGFRAEVSPLPPRRCLPTPRFRPCISPTEKYLLPSFCRQVGPRERHGYQPDVSHRSDGGEDQGHSPSRGDGAVIGKPTADAGTSGQHR